MASNINNAQKVLQELLEKNVESVESMTLQIAFCNPIGGDPFTAAVVTTQENLSTLPDYPSQRTNLLKFKHVWDIEKIQKIINTKRVRREDQHHCTKRIKLVHNYEEAAFTTLEAYMKDFDHHQKCLQKVLGSNDLKETAATMVLSSHLFGPLSDGNCIIDSHIAKKEDCFCSCGCGKEIKGGNTGIGVDSTWHGYADMIVKENLPVAILDMGEPKADQEEVEEQDVCACKIKKDCVAFGVRDKQKSATSLLIAETITNAFAQVNSNECIAGLPIPVFGCTSSLVFVYSYDCKNDVLLKKTVPLHLFRKSDSVFTVVMIWLYMNFQFFMKKDVTDLEVHSDLSEYQARFFSCDENIKEFYANVKSGFTGCRHPNQPLLTGVVRIDKE